MKFISTQMHGALDYVTAFLLLAMPYMLHYETGTMAGRIFIILGVSTVCYSLITKYEFGIMNIIPMQLHLVFDVVSGILLAASPWLFGFHDVAYLPHLIIGLFEVVVAITTKTKAFYGS